MDRIRTRLTGTIALAAAVLAAQILGTSTGGPVVFGAVTTATEQATFERGAPLKTDSELERRLEKAAQLAREGRYDLATILWQSVLAESADTLISRDGRRYSSIAEEVERVIADLPPEGLRIYRISADGEAKAILAAGKDNPEAAWNTVEKRYFLSSLGDDAAYRLGCLALDRYDFVTASRLFTKILQRYPDPTVDRSDVLLRLAVAAARIGDTESARRAITQADTAIRSRSTGTRQADLLALIRRDSQRVVQQALQILDASGDWNLALGNASRQGTMRPMRSEATAATLTKTWHYRFPMNFTVSSEQAVQVPIYNQANSPQINVARTDRGAIARWKKSKWLPAGEMLISDGRIYFKTNEDLTCWNAAALDNDPVWRSAWRNQFQLDQTTRLMLRFAQATGTSVLGRDRPTSQAEVLLFGDRVHHSMSIAHGNIYSIEGDRFPRRAEKESNSSEEEEAEWFWGITPRRSRQNWLAAYDARTGKARWYRSPSEEEEETTNFGYVAAPVPVGNLLLVPFTDSGSIWLQALDSNDGSVQWQTFLCDEPPGGCSIWSPVGVSVEGRDAYVVCGAGVIFALDAVAGEIRFAVRYQRHGELNDELNNFGFENSEILELNGWDNDLAIPYGRQLVVLASDHNQIFSIDRRTGDLLWTSPRTPLEHSASYCLGLSGSRLFVAGRNCVRRYDLDKEGKMIWEVIVEDSMGRGMLTENAIYLPVGSTIVRLAPESGAIVSHVDVHLSAERENPDPVGNLYSDGHRIWVLNGNNIFALTNREHRLATLSDQAAEGDVAALLERMQLWAKENKIEPAIKDLLKAVELIADSAGESQAGQMLFDGLLTINLPSDRPSRTLQLLAGRYIEATKNSTERALTKELTHQMHVIIALAPREMLDGEKPGDARSILRVAPIMLTRYQQRLVRRALLANQTRQDADLLLESLQSQHWSLPVVAAEPIATLLGEGARGPLMELIGHENDQVRYAAARGLASLRDRASLPVFVDLLQSQEVDIRHQSVHTLKSLTGESFHFNAYTSADHRDSAVKDWQQWLMNAGDKTELKLPLPDTEPMLGRTLIASYSLNQVIEIDANGNEQTQTIQGAWAVHGLPNGHRLVASYGRNSVVEYDNGWREVWRREQLPGNPFSVRRLRNGNTLLACSNSNQIVEIAPDGDLVREISVTSRPMDARRLEKAIHWSLWPAQIRSWKSTTKVRLSGKSNE